VKHTQESSHQHCWHAHRGPIWMVVPNGHILQDCCKCHATRLIHVDHAYGYYRHLRDLEGRPNQTPNPNRWLVNGVPRREIY